VIKRKNSGLLWGIHGAIRACIRYQGKGKEKKKGDHQFLNVDQPKKKRDEKGGPLNLEEGKGEEQFDGARPTP